MPIQKIDSTEMAIDVLSKLKPTDANSDSRQCIQAAIGAAAQLHSKEAVPELILSIGLEARGSQSISTILVNQGPPAP
jgi:hypothetical protein